MKCLSFFINNRLNRQSFSYRLEWSLRCSFSFLISGLFALFFKELIVIPFLLPVLVLVVSNETFGKTMNVSQSMYRGTLLISFISTIFYFIPIINEQYWYITLIYFFMITLFLTVTLSSDSTARKVSLAYHVIFTLHIAYNTNKTEYRVSEIWESWLLVPITIIISSVGVLIPMPIFAYQQLIFVEEKSIETIRNWLNDMIQFFQCTNKIHSKIQLAKLGKYAMESSINTSNISSLYPFAKHYELISDKNQMLNEKRIDELYALHHLCLAMYDTIKYQEYDSFQNKLLIEIKDSLKRFIDYLLECLKDKSLVNNKQIKSQLIRYNNELLKTYETARYKLLYNDNLNKINQNNTNIMKSVNSLHSFVYFLQTFTERCMKYLVLYSEFSAQKQLKLKCSKYKLFCSLSLYDILYPLPFISWKDFKDKASPFIHCKSSVFIQSLSISIAMTLCGLFFIYPPAHDSYKLGFWAALTVAFVSDNNIGGTFHTSMLRLEGTFMGVTCGFIILQLQKNSMPEIVGILLLTVWMLFCGYYRSHPSRGYSGLVAGFTAALIVIGYDDSKGYGIEIYAIRRIEMTFIGIAAILVVLQLCSPNNARKLLDKEMMGSLEILKTMFDDIFNRYKEMINCSKTIKDDIHNIKTNEFYPNMDDNEEESKNDIKLDLISNDDINDERILIMRESPDELYIKFKSCKLKVTQLLDSEKILINASVFEPMLWKQQFNDEMYFKLHHTQFWMLRRVSQIDLCLRSLLLYIEKQNESQWLLNTDLVHDITPFSNYLMLFEKCHDVIILSMEYFIKQLNAKNKKQKKNKNGKLKSYEDVMLELETVTDAQWIEFENMINKYLEINNMKNINENGQNNNQLLSTKGALVINALKFAVKNLMQSLSEFAECKISY